MFEIMPPVDAAPGDDGPVDDEPGNSDEASGDSNGPHTATDRLAANGSAARCRGAREPRAGDGHGDATQAAGPGFACTNAITSGTFTVTVSTPIGIKSYQYVTIND
jgi:hypothetical protein